MDDKYLLLLAFDALLLSLDCEYEPVSEEQFNLLQSKVYEGYGLKITSTNEDYEKIKELLIQDVRKYRKQLFEEI
ncbi:hypothetical protein M670_00464 [Schinkia azotoformans MEV2011]|uniref:Uncharacterized protein n=1 Tax=Schinkia azotoformans MEV2011 TaxID=1348973 RepID=A0A072NU82_SCHAZ|nr:hypothetical protein [Schinkia azotoformans]KEF40438.1 hypothetical protein M670_00464 [Schinkia azotoformans MEV2011]MEC1696152.1 hypothetical protein [Schinkia azotoformans]MEC1716632.1 hypothetical protein [Schinkia azotoformans]MEC1725345.1 hypothetical protein [Schinkia azotoformans]MEC1739471.1 hypothetical protein [Schinkia azotoformans]